MATMCNRPTVARDEVGAGDAVGRVLGQVDDTVEQVDEEPVERAGDGDEPRVAAGQKPAERERAERGDGHDV